MTVEKHVAGENAVKCKPAGKGEQFEITPIVWTKFLKKLKNDEKYEIEAKRGPKHRSILSTELDQGVTIKVEENTRLQENNDYNR